MTRTALQLPGTMLTAGKGGATAAKWEYGAPVFIPDTWYVRTE